MFKCNHGVINSCIFNKFKLMTIIFIYINIFGFIGHAKNLGHLSKLDPRDPFAIPKFSFGTDLNYHKLNNKGDLNKIFDNNRCGGNVYIGYNINNVTFEIGYGFTARRSKGISINNGATFLGKTFTSNDYIIGKIRFKNTNLSLNFFSNICTNLQAITSIGIESARPHPIIFNRLNNSLAPKIKTTIVPRAGFGLCLELQPNLFIRSMLLFQKYSKIKYQEPSLQQSGKPFHNGYTALIGGFLKL